MTDYSKVPYVEVIKKRNEMLNDFGRVCGRCAGVGCLECPLDVTHNGSHYSCEKLKEIHPEEYVKIIMEYEPKVDWSTVKVDTPILVKDNENDHWKRGYFAMYTNGTVCAWQNGMTSWTSNGHCNVWSWKYAKLYKPE